MNAVAMYSKCDVVYLCVILPLIYSAIILAQAVFVVVIFEVTMLINTQKCVHSIGAPPILLQYLCGDGDRLHNFNGFVMNFFVSFDHSWRI